MTAMPSSKKQRSRKAKLEKKRKEEEREAQQKREVCRHGAPPRDSALMPAYEHALQYFITRMEGPDMFVFKDFGDKYPSLCTDEGFLRFIIGDYTNVVLQQHQNDEVDAYAWETHTCMVLALNLLYCVIPASKGEDVGLKSENMSTYIHYMKRIDTRKGLILFLNKHADCKCLNELAAVAKQMQSTRDCVSCEKEMPRDEIWLCSGCKITSYCGTECQTKDW